MGWEDPLENGMCETFSLAEFSLNFILFIFFFTLTSREEHKMKTTNHLTSGRHFVTLQKPSFCNHLCLDIRLTYKWLSSLGST